MPADADATANDIISMVTRMLKRMLLLFVPADADVIDADNAVAASDNGRASGAIISSGGGGRGVLRQLRSPQPATFFQSLFVVLQTGMVRSIFGSAKTNKNVVFAVVVTTMVIF